MRRMLIALASIAGMTGMAVAADDSSRPGASGASPGHRMQSEGSKPGSPGASGHAPGQEKKSEGAGSTAGSSATDTKGLGSGATSK